MKAKRKIIKIDEEKCDGCGLCATACAEGAIEIRDGKARLVSETYCDGLGACLGECPQGAISFEEREAEAFDESAVKHRAQHVKAVKPQAGHDASACGCPGSAAHTLKRIHSASIGPSGSTAVSPSELTNWPVQIRLVPVQAPYLNGAHLLISADCAPFAFADFHSSLLAGKVALIGCPKLDDGLEIREKLAMVFAANEISAVDVVHMEVPCCWSLATFVSQAIAQSGKKIPATIIKVGIRGEILERKPLST
jgi:Fe-S-cluster-containing hydrogenase component 2